MSKITLQPSLNATIEMVTRWHANQTDKQGHPYILHVLAVMAMMDPNNPWDLIVALLHDVAEDTPITLQNLCELGYDVEILAAVDALTHRDREPYDAYIDRVIREPRARRVKLADISHNLSRIDQLPQADRDRLRPRYSKALRRIKEAL